MRVKSIPQSIILNWLNEHFIIEELLDVDLTNPNQIRIMDTDKKSLVLTVDANKQILLHDVEDTDYPTRFLGIPADKMRIKILEKIHQIVESNGLSTTEEGTLFDYIYETFEINDDILIHKITKVLFGDRYDDDRLLDKLWKLLFGAHSGVSFDEFDVTCLEEVFGKPWEEL